MTKEDYDTITAMEKYGGAFAKAIAKAFAAGDPANRRTLAEAFPELFSRYRAMAAAEVSNG